MTWARWRRWKEALLELDPNRRRAELRWWRERARLSGARAVYHRGHGPQEIAEVDRKQKALLYPLLQQALRGDEQVILDFGCGPGRFTPDLAALIGGRAIGVDPTQALLDAAPSADNVAYLPITDGRIPLESGSVDAVWSCIVLTCITDPEALRTAVREIERVLRPGGLVFLIENTADKPDRRHVAFRSVEAYQELFSFAPLEHACDYEDMGERISVMSGRKGSHAHA